MHLEKKSFAGRRVGFHVCPGTSFLLALNSWIPLKAWVPPFSLVVRLRQTARGTAGEFARTEIRRALLPTWGLEGLAMAYNQFKFCTVRGNAPRKSAWQSVCKGQLQLHSLATEGLFSKETQRQASCLLPRSFAMYRLDLSLSSICSYEKSSWNPRKISTDEVRTCMYAGWIYICGWKLFHKICPWGKDKVHRRHDCATPISVWVNWVCGQSMFASSWFWTQEPHIITQIKSMTAMLLQVFRHKADLGHLLCENAKVRGAFSCLELLLWHAAQHSAFSCRPVARCPIVREQKCPKCWVDLQSFPPPTKLVCSTDFIDAYILGDTSRFFPAAFRFLSVTEGILLSTEVRMVRSTWLTGDVLGSGKLPRAKNWSKVWGIMGSSFGRDIHHSQIGLQMFPPWRNVTTYLVFCGGQTWLTMKTFVHAVANNSWLPLSVSWLSLAQASLLMRVSLAVFTMFLSIRIQPHKSWPSAAHCLAVQPIPLPHCLFICGQQIVGLSMSQIDLLETLEIIAFSQLPAGIWLYWLVMLPRHWSGGLSIVRDVNWTAVGHRRVDKDWLLIFSYLGSK